MAKHYPAIDYSETVPMTQTRNFPPRDYRLEVLIKQITRNTTSATTPHWPKAIQENDFSTTTTTFYVQPKYYDPFNGDPSWPGYRYVSTIGTPAIADAPRAIKSQCEYNALLDFYGKIPSVTANLALLYAERKKTGESILTALSGILKCIRDVKRGRVPELLMSQRQLRGRKRLSGAWLNYIYGIKPFCSDLYNIALSELNPVVWLKGDYTMEYQRHLNLGLKSYIHNTGTYKASWKGGLSLSNPITATLAGAGLTNPALIAWELTPFSFIADWLYPVGPFLEMLSSTSGYSKHSGSITRGTKEEYRQLNEEGAFAYGKFKRIMRSTVTFPDAPFPKLKNPYSPVRALNVLSIIHQSVKEKR